ncbi:MAG TPA: DUF6702 family protein [Pyrinomonadaceae bacterium]|jgi:hypothetical protein|nr:DUF6702 family protein [Pyrinomonadaceae bacterium]
MMTSKAAAPFVTLLLLLCLAPQPRAAAVAHKFYTSIAHAEYNERERKLEVSLRVFADDLENALSARSKRRVRLDSAKDAEALVFAYLQDSFEIRDAKGETAQLKWVGWEMKPEVVWLYFEAALPGGPEGARVRDEIFLSMFDNQVNTLNFKLGDRRHSLVFKRGDAGFKLFP